MIQTQWPESDDELHTFFEQLRLRNDLETQLLFQQLERYHAYRSRRQYRLGIPLPELQSVEATVPSGLRATTEEWIGWVPVFTNCELGEWKLLARGDRSQVQFPLRPFFLDLLRLEPAGFYLFHNHPSQSLLPSLEDVRLTRKIEDLAKTFGIRLLGHGIVGIRQIHWMMIGSLPRGKFTVVRKRSPAQRYS